jgi:hypothetical protein
MTHWLGKRARKQGPCCPQCRQVRQECSSLQEVDPLNAASLIAMGVSCLGGREDVIREGFLY